MAAATDRVRFCLLRDQQNLTEDEYRGALALRDRIRDLIAGRAAFLQAAGRDSEIHLPGGVWDLGESLHDTFNLVLDGRYEVLNPLRLYTQIYTGYQLSTLSFAQGKPLPVTMPPDLDDRLTELAQTPARWNVKHLDAYQKTIRQLPGDLHVSPPARFGEVGWLIDGNIVNHDTDAYLERVVLLAEHGLLAEVRRRAHTDGCVRILEIGSGYGGLAYHLHKLLPQARYFLLDLPESLLISSIYLTTLCPEKDNVLATPEHLEALDKTTPGFTFLPNYLFDDCRTRGLSFDLIINTLSMSEMSEKQVRYYCAGIAELLGSRGVFFEQNQDTRPLGHLHAQQVIERCLPWRLRLRSRVRRLRQGSANLWAAAPVPPHAWQPTSAGGGRVSTDWAKWTGRLRRFGGRLLRPLGLLPSYGK
jgi:hypothetical protein